MADLERLDIHPDDLSGSMLLPDAESPPMTPFERVRLNMALNRRQRELRRERGEPEDRYDDGY